MAYPLINPSHQFFDSSGSPLVDGTLEFRDPTSNNLINTYPTADDADAQTNANANPLTLDSRGGYTGLYLEDGVKYKVILKNAAGGTEDTQDDVLCPSPNEYATTALETANSITPTDKTYAPGNVFRYGAIVDGVTDDTTAFNTAVSSGHPGFVSGAGTANIAGTIDINGGEELKLNKHIRLERVTGVSTEPLVRLWGDQATLDLNGGQIARGTGAHLKGVVLVGQDPDETFGGTTDVQTHFPVVKNGQLLGDKTRTDGSPVLYINSQRRKLFGSSNSDRKSTYYGQFSELNILNGDVLIEFSSDANSHYFSGIYLHAFGSHAILTNATYGVVFEGLAIETPLGVSSTRRYSIQEGYHNYSQIETGTDSAYGVSHAADCKFHGWAELPDNSSGDNDKIVSLFNHGQDAGPSKSGKTWGNCEYSILGSLSAGVGRDGLTGTTNTGKSSGRTRSIVWDHRVKQKWGNYFNYEPLDDDSGWISVEGGKCSFGDRKANMVEDFEYDLFSMDNIGPDTDTIICKLTYAGKESVNQTDQVGEVVWHCPVRGGSAQDAVEIYHHPDSISTSGVKTTKPFAFRVTTATGGTTDTGKFIFHLITDTGPASFSGFCDWDVELRSANSELVATPNRNWSADISILTTSTSGAVTRPVQSSETRYKTSNTNRSSSNTGSTLTDDPDLLGWVLSANTLYYIDGELQISCTSSTPDIQCLFQFDNAAAEYRIGFRGTGSETVDAAGTGTGAIQIVGTNNMLRISGYVLTHATLESVMDFQWAQNVSDAIAVFIYKSSWIRVRKATTLLNET